MGVDPAGAMLDVARQRLATLIGARDPKELVFTSGGTESINLALKGVAEMYREKGNHIVTTAIEQRAGLDVCKRLERQGLAARVDEVRPRLRLERSDRARVEPVRHRQKV